MTKNNNTVELKWDGWMDGWKFLFGGMLRAPRGLAYDKIIIIHI